MDIAFWSVQVTMEVRYLKKMWLVLQILYCFMAMECTNLSELRKW